MTTQHHATSLTRFYSQMMWDIWFMQLGLIKKHPKQVNRLLEHPRFCAAYDFLLLQIECRELPETLEAWWTKTYLACQESI